MTSRILILDGDPEIFETLDTLLSGEGYSVPNGRDPKTDGLPADHFRTRHNTPNPHVGSS